jgi:hypothetical protein
MTKAGTGIAGTPGNGEVYWHNEAATVKRAVSEV